MGANPPSATLSDARRGARALLVAVPLALFVRTFVVAPIRIPTESMEPTLRPGDRVLVARTLYGGTGRRLLDRWLPVRPPRPGDVLWIESPLAPGQRLVKRCAATAGQRFAGERVPDGRLAVVGDHRAASLDSRAFGTLPAADARGRVVLVLFSTHRGGSSWTGRILRRVR